jgi:WD40 repeat protein
MLELLYISTKVITSFGTGPLQLVFLTSWDSLLLLNGYRVEKIFRDGTQAILGSMGSGNTWGPGSRVGGRAYWIQDYGPGTATIYSADEIIGKYQLGEILNPTWPIPSNRKAPGNFVDEYIERYVVNGAAGIVYIYNLTTGSLLGQLQLNSTSIFDSLSYAGRNKVLAFQKSTGKIALIDYTNIEILWQGSVSPALVCAYDSKHDLVLTIASDLKVRIYLITPLPATLSAPEFYPAVASVTRKKGYPVRVRLTGAGGEPCVGYWVIWETPVLGYLQKTKSETDEDGYAWNFYFGPASLTGSQRLYTEVVI